MKNSLESITSLREEIAAKNSNWRDLHIKWTPTYEVSSSVVFNSEVKTTYMDHVMADSLNVPVTRSKCLFKAAISQMTSDAVLDASTSSADVSGLSEGEKFSLDLAGVNSENVWVRNVPEFSKFLFHLAKEEEMSVVSDPMRDIEKLDNNVLPLQFRKDRIL